jgi:hypothetical protein
MKSPLACATLGLAALLTLLSQTPGQPPDKDKDKAPPGKAAPKDKDSDALRRLLREPETSFDFWNRIQFEMDVGEYSLAARYLSRLLLRKPSEADLVEIAQKAGMPAILSMERVPKWYDDPKLDEQARKDVKTFIGLVSAAVRKHLGDPSRIKELLKALGETEAERKYAVDELRKSGPLAVPFFLQALREAKDPAERVPLLQGLRQMKPDVVPALLAALDTRDVFVKVDILDTLRRSFSPQRDQIVPYLWFLSASPDEAEAVRSRARKMLADFLDLDLTKLPPAKGKLALEAERYYLHKVRYDTPEAVPVWRWAGSTLVQGWPGALTVPARQADDYYALKFARQALSLDPAYRPAQVIALSSAVDAATNRGGLTKPLAQTDPTVYDLLARSSADLLIDVLQRALSEQRTGVALAAVRALGERAEVRAKKPTEKADPALVQALYYPDSRVQLAAAEALIRIPGPPPPRASARVVDILRRALAPSSAALEGRKVIVAINDADWRRQARRAVEEAGAVAIPVATGREVLQRIREGADIDLIITESNIPFPTLPYLLAQLAADRDAAKIPVLLAAVPEPRETRAVLTAYRGIGRRLDSIRDATRAYRRAVEQLEVDRAARIKAIEAKRYLTGAERSEAIKEEEQHSAEARRQLDFQFREAAVLEKDVPKLEREAKDLASQYERKVEARAGSLERFLARSEQVTVVRPTLLIDPAAMRETIYVRVQEAGTALSEAEKKDHAERAIKALAALAQGTPAGYDIRPAADAILDALRQGRLSEAGQLYAITAAGYLPDPRVQTELAAVVLDGKRAAAVRNAAASELLKNMQKRGALLTAAQVQSLRELAAQPKLAADLKAEVLLVLGSLSRGDRTSGERLREYRPTPAGVIPPPAPDK